MSMTDEYGRPEPQQQADEVTTLLGFLDFLRATIEWKTRDLSDAQLQDAPLSRAISQHAMSLNGLLKHLAYVEDFWFGRVIGGEGARAPWKDVDWAATPDWEWESARGESGDAVRSEWIVAMERSREISAAHRDLDDLVSVPNWDEPASVRWVFTHMIEEYARHCGHADLMREALDGSVGE